ncbi:MAG: TonB-dependent receptor family protein [Bacteroidaceae bacterium]|nr:TonB-dependent receptor family protein [Bacteroidaceae bacterium]
MRQFIHLRFTALQLINVFVTILQLTCCPVQAQQIVNRKFVNCKYNDVSLSEALHGLNNEQTEYVINFLYNDLEDFRITTNVSHKTLPDAIQQMIGFYPVRMTVKTNDHEIYVECTHKTARRLTGTIIDEQGQSVAYANVAILNPSDSTLLCGGVSNESGYFAIPYEQLIVLARISYVGYQTIYKICNQPALGTITLQSDNYTLKDVTVKGHVPQYKMGSEGLVTNVDNTPLSQLGTADDVLKHVPGIIQKNDSYEVFGKGKPLIYINGRLMRNPKELEQLKSTDIKSIELITNPGAKYDATVGAIVKIQTVRKAGDGFSIDTWGRWRQGRKGQETASLDMNYRRNGLDIFASVRLDRVEYMQQAEIRQEVQGDTLWRQDNEMRHDLVNHAYTVEGGFNYLLDEHHTFGTKYELTLPKTGDDVTTLTSNVTANGQFYDKWQNLSNKQMNGNLGHKLNAYYVGQVGKLDIDWNFDFLHSSYDDQSRSEEICQMQDDRLVNAENKVRNRMLASKLTLTYPLLGGSLDFGAEYVNTNRQDDYVNPQNYVPTTYSTLKEQSISPYLEFTRMIPRVGQLRAGLRYEHVRFRYYDCGQLVDEQSRRYDNFYPSLSLSTQIGKVQAQLTYSVKTRRPTYRELSNDVFYANRYSLQRGNPLLDNTTIHNLSLQAMWKFLQFSISYADERGHIINWMEQTGHSNVTLMTYKNIHSLKWLMPYVTLAPAWGIWHPQLSIGIRKQWLTLDTTEGDIKLNKPLPVAQVNNTFAFSKTFTGELNFSYQGLGHYENAYLGYHRTDLGISLVKTFFNDHLSIKLAGEDLLDRNREAITCYTHHVHLQQGNYYARRRFVATIRYKFNTTRSKYKGTGAGNDEKNRL